MSRSDRESSVGEAPGSVETRLERVLLRTSALVDRGVIDDPVVPAYLRSLQQRLANGQIGDAITSAQLEYLEEMLKRLPKLR
jgi:hypothetical protein